MNADEPHVRRRGFFLHSTDGSEPETGEHENQIYTSEPFIEKGLKHRTAQLHTHEFTDRNQVVPEDPDRRQTSNPR